MIIYTNLNQQHINFKRLESILWTIDANIKLKNGIKEYNLDEIKTGQRFVVTQVGKDIITEIKQEPVLFWFAKSHSNKLSSYRICEGIENIYQGLELIENHKELVK